MTILLNTNDYDTAKLCGYDSPCDPLEDGSGFILSGENHIDVGPCITIIGPDGGVEFAGFGELQMIVDEISRFLASARRMANRAADPAQ